MAIPFQIAISGQGTTGYTLRATSPGGDIETLIELPVLTNDMVTNGEMLGPVLFPPPVHQLLLEAAHTASEAGNHVQIQLHMALPEVAILPWEWITLGRSTPWQPAIRDDYPLIRVGRITRSRPALPLSGPIRLLIACAPGAAAAAAAPLGHALAQPVREGRLVVDLLRDADPFMLREALAEEPCHALHLVAADATGQGSTARLRLGRALDAAGLAGIIGDYQELRLLTLAADLGAEAVALASIAGAVHDRLGIATLALGDLDNAGVATFCGPCYEALVADEPVDLATTDGRAALAEAEDAWGSPRLWVVPGSEYLFNARMASVARQSVPADAVAGEAAPVGKPLRTERTFAGAGQMASRALTSAKAFVVGTTTVGEPAQRARNEAPRKQGFSPKLVALIIAVLVLILLISQVLPSSTPPPPVPTVVPTSALPLLEP
ncbi:polysaccharide deacetylase [Candidatus Chloroploca asiatica]|uniref:Polysaccharide deacetylase n=1 Tax=Candidatus Chloroploca asiatica TaxID=1506545 RepID=A0A2H3KHK7_9CHLR|nr:polysaccharide deacetylase [Candidatus Chloroploca asiatica]PDV97243.1 hypothetical protein A9Q02_04880 [Candidatus Chloroploca asiatica]